MKMVLLRKGQPRYLGRTFWGMKMTVNPNVAEKAAHVTGKPSWRKVLGLIAMVHSLARWVLSCHARAGGHPVVESRMDSRLRRDFKAVYRFT